MQKHEQIHIGTCGWHYEHWSGPFYPSGLGQEDFLAHYASQFSTVEINNTFYQLPDKEVFVGWRERTPEGFLFAVKANRYITHMKKLSDPREPLANMLEAVRELEDKLGPIRFQLPPSWHVNVNCLRRFLEVLPNEYRYAFEFRDPTWFDSQVYELLRAHHAVFCIHDLASHPSPKVLTSDMIYVRLHGPSGRYQGRYTRQMLAGRAILVLSIQPSSVTKWVRMRILRIVPGMRM
jgi:uncharacterized protein YecE (DUF72 family)